MADRVRMILPRPDLCHLISENTLELWTLPAAFVCHGGSLGKIQINLPSFSFDFMWQCSLLKMHHWFGRFVPDKKHHQHPVHRILPSRMRLRQAAKISFKVFSHLGLSILTDSIMGLNSGT